MGVPLAEDLVLDRHLGVVDGRFVGVLHVEETVEQVHVGRHETISVWDPVHN